MSKLDCGSLTGEENLIFYNVLKVEDHIQFLEDIADTAIKEFTNEKILN